MLSPIIVAIVTFVFGSLLLQQYATRRKPYQLVWTLSLYMGCLAALGFVLFLADNRSAAFFRVYYVFGGLLMAAYLGLGELYLLAPRRLANWVAAVVTAISVVGVVLLITAHVNTVALHSPNVEGGTKVISGAAVIPIAVLNSFGALTVIGGAGYSAYRVWKRRSPRMFLLANLCIAVGTLLASVAGTLARVMSSGTYFWLLLAVGFIVLFAGFLLASSPSRRTSRSAST